MGLKTYTPKIQQTGAAYGVAAPDVPLKLDEELGKKLVKTGNWVAGLTDCAKERAKDEKAKAAKAKD